MRRTKIVATIGPASDSETTLEALLKAGVNVFRFNFSHGSADDHRHRVDCIRNLARKHDMCVALLGDLQGPKIRIGKFKSNSITLVPGTPITLDPSLKDNEGDDSHIGVDYKPLPQYVKPGDILLLDDGRIRLRVEKVHDNKVLCHSECSGELFPRKGINRLGGGLFAPALTEKDRGDIKLAAELELDYVAVSFPGSADDIETARQLLREAGSDAAVIGKIERAEAVADDQQLDSIINACDGVMVARGDLGVEIGDAQLIAVQKHIIHRARQLNRAVITATQMMESMIHSPVPTRAEVFDVANAVLDGTDAVMLSAETANGKYPVDTVLAMARTCEGAEQYPALRRIDLSLDRPFKTTEEAIATSAMYAANHLEGVKAIVSLTETGKTALWMSRLNSNLPIFALSRREDTCNRVSLYRGVTAIPFSMTGDVTTRAIEALQERGLLQEGDTIVMTRGDKLRVDGNTNVLKILRV
ncbi:MAG: pyruvate kinase [Gammaproteobacteria bacterium]|nr:MAG: pyruvate kinase [Gammaproteobacteria bacterium]